MITIKLEDMRNPQEICLLFEYDVQGILRAFFPKEKTVTDGVTKEKNVTERIRRGNMEEKQAEDEFMKVSVIYDVTDITIACVAENLDETVNFPVNWDDRKEVKNIVKRQLYQILEDYTKRSLPWGTLSGIRPTKIPLAMMEEGMSDDEIRDEMKQTYLISDEKLDLSMDICRKEMQILKDTDYENGYSVYIGIPFCPSRCLYCSFTSYPIHSYKNMVEEYVDALCHEIEEMKDCYGDRTLLSVYVGGGTPTTLEPRQMRRLLQTVKDNFDFSNVREFTVEAGRPDSITREKLMVLKEMGVSRISINPQTMNDETLQFIGRAHSVQQVKDAFALARECGFDNINMDFIIGLPNEDLEDVKHSMEETAKLLPDSITVHSLAIKRASALREKIDALGMESELSKVTDYQEIISLTQQYASRMSMRPYYMYRQKNIAGNMENVGYAREGKEGYYNIFIIEEKHSILAFGAGGATKLVFSQDNKQTDKQDNNRIVRVENVKDVKNYIDRVDEMIERKRSALQG